MTDTETVPVNRVVLATLADEANKAAGDQPTEDLEQAVQEAYQVLSNTDGEVVVR